MALLRRGQLLPSGNGSRRYRVEDRLGLGGFGETYSGWQVDRWDRRRVAVCIKVTVDDTTWHGESYFGQLLRGQDRVVQLLDSFPLLSHAGGAAGMRYVLVFELEEQTIAQWFAEGGSPWSEATARRELVGLLKVLEKLHGMGATHRDIKPDNVFVRRRRLKLGDFGIARHGLGGRPVYADAFAKAFVPLSLFRYNRGRWYPSDDLYQLALLTVGLIEGNITPAFSTSTRAIRRLGLGPELADALARSIGPRSRRFRDATEMLRALGPAGLEVPTPPSLRGLRVVFTGALPVLRHEAIERLAQVGGEHQDRVNGRTDVVVIGSPSPNYRTPRRGAKLADVNRRIKAGQPIATIGWQEFVRLTPTPRRKRR